MPVSIIENFQLGTNLPLDARYVVGDPNDVSLYWYDGMLIYNSSTNQLFVVKDTLTEEIVEILDSSSAQIQSIDGSISDLYVDQSAQDVSIKWLADNTYDKTYIDGSLNLKVSQTLFDSSISELTIKNSNQDTSINDLWVDQLSQDASISLIRAIAVANGLAIFSLDASIQRIDSSLNYILPELDRLDSSINTLFLENDIQDASIVINRADISTNTYGIAVLLIDQLSQDSSIVALRNEDIRQDGSLNLLFQENDAQDASIVDLRADISTNAFGIGVLFSDQLVQDASIVALRNEDIRIDGSLNLLFQENDIQDASIISLRAEDVRQDGSLNLLFLENNIQDASIERIDASLGDYVRKDGDTMTGPLFIDSSLRVTGNTTLDSNVDIRGDLRVDGSTSFIHTDILDVSTGWIYLNTGLTGTPPAWLQSGIVVERGDASSYAFIYDETRNEFRVGIVGLTDASGVYDDADTQAVATREDTPIDFGIPYWNESEYRFDTSINLLFTDKLLVGIDVSINAKLKTEEFNVSGTGFPTTPENGDLFYRRDLYQEFVYDSSRGKWITTNRATYTCGRSTAQKNATVYMGIADAVMSSAQGLRMPRNGVITAVSIDNATTATANRILDIRVNNSTTNRIQLTVGTGTKGAYSTGGNLNFAANDLIQAVLLPNGADNFDDILVSFEAAWRE